ncbi:MAG: ribose-phosphate pyrophosphokinase [Bacteroidia bacterium]|nr:ribose-phosphate pyrophosphokinase [Bacteroidia bacterium]
MTQILFGLPGNEKITHRLANHLKAEVGEFVSRKFPDGETYIQVTSDVRNKEVLLVCTLDRPDEKLLPLFFLSKLVKELGAQCTCLIAPYLAYMRQDKRFKPGEAITSKYFGKLVSHFIDNLVTVDPHLHRTDALSKIYDIPSSVLHASNHISTWIKNNVNQPVLIGPDSESEQWVFKVAEGAGSPFTILEKTRFGDRDVQISNPELVGYKNHTPVLVDDIISTARTMIETVGHLKRQDLPPPICIGVHAIFAQNSYQDLLNSGVSQVVTCNTVIHESNRIDLSDLLAYGINSLTSNN